MEWTLFIFLFTFGKSESIGDISLCIQRIVETHFPQKHVISVYFSRHWDNKYRTGDIKDVSKTENEYLTLEASLLATEKWSVMIQDWKKGYSPLRDVRVAESYVALFVQYPDTVAEIRKWFEQLKERNSRNRRSYYIIALLQQNNLDRLHKTTVNEIFVELWQMKIVNAVVLQQIVSDVERNTTMSAVISVYNWSPYSLAANCGQVGNADLKINWTANSRSNKNFFLDIELFPNTAIKNFNNCPVTISSFEYNPHMMKPRLVDGKLMYTDGIDMHLLQMMARSMNFSVVFREPPSDGKWGFIQKNGDWTGVSGEMIQGKSDMALVGWYYRCHIILEIECTTPYILDESRWYVPCAKPVPRWTSITRVFSGSLWLAFLLTHIVVSVLLWIIIKFSNLIAKTVGKGYSSLIMCFINLWAVVLGESAFETVPRRAITRTVFLLWVIYSLTINTVYQTYLTTFMVDPGLQHQISTEDEILTSGIAYGIPDSLIVLFPEMGGSRYGYREICIDVDSCQRRVAYGANLALYFSRYNLEYMIAAHYVNSNGEPLICQVDDSYRLQYMSIPVQRGSVFLDHFNHYILTSFQAGLFNQWWKDIKRAATLKASKNYTTTEADDSYVSLSTDHLQSAFYFLILGYAVSLAGFFAEKFYGRRYLKQIL